MVRVIYADESFDVPLELLRLYQDLAVRAALEKVVYRPLQSPGIDVVEFGDRILPSQRVNEAEGVFFRSPEVPEKVLVSDTRVAAFSILSLAFKEDNKWRLHDGSNSVSAVIEDEEFLGRVNRNQIRFAKGDVLGGVDKFEPVSGGGDMDHAEEAFGELVVSGGDGAVDFQTAKVAFDVIAFTVERPVMFDFDPAV